jgi:predicted membrane metal-binding protein
VLGLVKCSLLVFETGLVIFKVIGGFTLYLGVQVVWLLNIAAVKSKQIFYKPTAKRSVYLLCFYAVFRHANVFVRHLSLCALNVPYRRISVVTVQSQRVL